MSFAVVVGWFNEEQGLITGFDNATFAVTVDIPIGAQLNGQSATVSSLTIAQTTSSAPGNPVTPPKFFNLTDQVAGTVLTEGSTFEVETEIELDLSLEQDYIMLITLVAETETGKPCTSTGLYNFTAGGSIAAPDTPGACPELRRY